MRHDSSIAACLLTGGLLLAPLLRAQEPPPPPAAPAPPAAPRIAGSRMYVAQSGGGYLGIGVADIDAERAKALNLREERGAEIKSISKESPAEKAGLKEGDVVLEYNGQRVEGTEQFQRMVRETPAGRQAKLTISRGGSTQTITATLGTRKAAAWMTGPDGDMTFTMPNIPPITVPVMPDMPGMHMTWRNPVLGIEGESVGAQLAEFFGVKDGVLVRSVVKNSAADKAGIKAGDVITKVDDAHVTSTREISSALRAKRSQKTFPIVLMRNKREMTVTVTIDEQRSSGTRVRARERSVRGPRLVMC